MKKYEFVKIELKNNYVVNAVTETHREIIISMAQKGYVYSGLYPQSKGRAVK